MNRKATKVFLAAVLAVLAIGALFAASASASPAWKFNGEELSGTETILGGAEKSGMTAAGLTTTCDNFLYEIAITNEKGSDAGDLEDLPLFNCYTNAEVCTVAGIEANELPWETNLNEISGSSYLIVNEVNVGILYGGEECALNELLVTVSGNAGGEIDNGTESATFDSASFEATETELTAFGEAAEWTGYFPSEAFEWHREDALSVE